MFLLLDHEWFILFILLMKHQNLKMFIVQYWLFQFISLTSAQYLKRSFLKRIGQIYSQTLERYEVGSFHYWVWHFQSFLQDLWFWQELNPLIVHQAMTMLNHLLISLSHFLKCQKSMFPQLIDTLFLPSSSICSQLTNYQNLLRRMRG